MDRWRTSVGVEDALKVQPARCRTSTAPALLQAWTGQASQRTVRLQAAHAGNQLLALQSQQLADLIATMAAMNRAQALDC